MQVIRVISALRAARSALGWNQPELAQRSGVGLVTIARMESGMMSPRLSTIAKLKTAIEGAGVRIADDYPAGGFTLTVTGPGIEEACRNQKSGRGVGDAIGGVKGEIPE